ncbi:MAG TPA: SUF system NifU family Fe-S cluster assembly protein [Erysipelotrichaceae bacterium]|jgi:nitrogen fixation NifU-like protein|nr:SUF system NifU family Fe-S cluster assembly protein [Erysipelotrichaceae bacterium]HCY06531.1 SUF system NifU family Fe-S cluster assembly protein [Erysipelotrichaceae bacterium]
MNNLLNDPAILRDIILDHYSYPRNKGLKTGDKYKEVHMASESCIDDITVQSVIEDGVIKEINFDGIACTISTASTSMMTELLIDKTIEEAKVIMDNYFSMLDGQAYDAEILEEAVAMKNVYKQANRIKCATIGWNAMKQIVLESESKDE